MIRIFKTGLSSSSDSPEVLTAELGQQTSPGRRGFGPKSSGHRSPGGGASILANKRLTLPFLAFVAVLAAGLLFLLPGGLLQAQDSVTIEYAEGGEDVVAMFTAMDPEGGMVSWTLTEAGTADFMIDDDGMLKFIEPPDFEDPKGGDDDDSNTYSIVVNASDGADTPNVGMFNVTVMVTNVAEEGKVTWTVDPDGDGATLSANEPPAKPIMQFQPGAKLVASATDGDASTANPLSITTWQWYRSSSKTSTGTAISGANSNEYTVKDDADNSDVGKYLHVKVFYNIGTGPEESASLASDYPVQAYLTNNSAPEFASTTVIRQVNEGKKGMAVGAPVTATDADRDVLNYTLAGADEDEFEIDQKTGQIKTKVDLNFEADAGTAANCTDKNSCEVEVTATDSAGTPTATVATVTIHIMGVDEKPGFDAGNEMVTVNEGVTVLDGDNDDSRDAFTGENVYAATDPDGKTVTLSLMGNDKDMFRLNASDVLTFRMAPDYEKPMDKNKDNTYEVTVRASDGTMHEDRMVTVTVDNVNEAPEIMEGGLSISGSSSMYFSEGETDADATFTARGPMKDMARWTLEGADARYFRVGTARAAMTELMFSRAPDYEMPRGRAMSDTNTNTYMVTLKANDGTYMDTHDVRVMVTNVEEDGTVMLSSMTPVVGVELTASLTDSDGGVMDVTWVWETSSDMSTWAAGGGTAATSMDMMKSTYTPVMADDGMYLRATATYTDDYGDDTAMAATTAAVTAAVTAGDPLVIRYDTNPANGMIDKAEVIAAINEYLDAGADAPSKADVIRLINLYLDG